MSEVLPIQQFTQLVDEILEVNGETYQQTYVPISVNANIVRHSAPQEAIFANLGNVVIEKTFAGRGEDELLAVRSAKLAGIIKVIVPEGASKAIRSINHTVDLSYAMARQLAGEFSTSRDLEDDELLALNHWLETPLLKPNPDVLLAQLSEAEVSIVEERTIDAQKLDRQFADIMDRGTPRSRSVFTARRILRK